jgi:hypothetical protein
MKLKLNRGLLLSATLLIITNSLYALSPQPENCPEARVIKQVGVSQTVLKVDNSWVAGRRNQRYETHDHWSFVMSNIHAANATDAFHTAQSALRSLNFQVGPVSSGDKWICVYNTIEGYPAYTITTPIALENSKSYTH